MGSYSCCLISLCTWLLLTALSPMLFRQLSTYYISGTIFDAVRNVKIQRKNLFPETYNTERWQTYITTKDHYIKVTALSDMSEIKMSHKRITLDWNTKRSPEHLSCAGAANVMVSRRERGLTLDSWSLRPSGGGNTKGGLRLREILTRKCPRFFPFSLKSKRSIAEQTTWHFPELKEHT